ncbi:receptor activity-modifying protein 2 isoform X2 [Chanos chanos]|uniref:Receptor activity-modifying protein 2 isoform X2 n=1 Tax=Chanos chanos TaxID=29144 RepID=A0A6J2WZF2_CHACN|nr:receptor activity-modifying protein 2 isoform X2 [Chanos chanos]
MIMDRSSSSSSSSALKRSSEVRLFWVCAALLIGQIQAVVPNGHKADTGRMSPPVPSKVSSTISSPVYRDSDTENTTTDVGRGQMHSSGFGNKTTICPVYWYHCMIERSNSTLMDCYEELFNIACLTGFEKALTSNTDPCSWEDVKRPYDILSECSEVISECLLIPWPNPAVERMFVEIHSSFFVNCPTHSLRDPPPSIVFALVMTPICLIPAMVILVVFKTKNGDGSS